MTLTVFFMSALTSSPFGLRKGFSSFFDLLLKGLLFNILFYVFKLLDTVEIVKIISQRSLDAFLAFLAYRRLTKVGWKDAHSVRWFPYMSRTGDVLRISKRWLPRKKRTRERLLFTENLSLVGTIYESFERMSLSDHRKLHD